MALTEIPSELSSTPSIVDNGNATAITIGSDESVSLGGALTVDTNTLVVDATNNRVGIGTSSPSVRAHVNSTVSGLPATSGTTQTNGVFRLSSTATSGIIDFGMNGINPWIQSTGSDGLGATYNLLLNPNGGNVGIGCSPTSQLEIDESGSGDATIKVGNAQNVQTTNVGKQGATAYGATAAGAAFLYTYDNDISIMSDGGTGSIKFTTGGNTQKMELSAAGNLLVGNTITNPASGFDAQKGFGYAAATGKVEIATTANDAVMEIGKNNANDGNLMVFRKQRYAVGSIGTLDGNSIYIGNGDVNLRMIDVTDDIRPVTSTGTNRDAAVDLGDANARFKDLYLSGRANIGNLLSMTDGTTNGFLTTTSGLMQFGTSTSAPIVFYTENTERVRLYASGKTVASASIAYDFIHYFQQTNANGYMLGVDTAGSSLAFFYKNGSTNIGSITTNGTSTSFNETSDERAKENIVDSPSASADIDSIQVRSFDWIETGEHQKYGTIAQELQSIAPYAVYEPENSEDMMGVDYSKLVPMLIKEIQSLRTRVQTLENN